MRLVKDPETRDMMQDFWDTLNRTQSLHAGEIMMRDKYGIIRARKTWQRIAKNTVYCGISHNNDHFCEPYISKEDFDTFQKRPRISVDEYGHNIYYFTGLIKCPVCGHTMVGRNKKRPNNKPLLYYRCNYSGMNCSFKALFRQDHIENAILARLHDELTNTITRAEITAKNANKRHRNDTVTLKERLRKLNVIYMNGNMSDEDYLKQSEEIQQKLKEADKPEPVRDYSHLRTLLNSDFGTIYKTLDESEKRQMWLRLLEEIVITPDREVKEIKFR